MEPLTDYDRTRYGRQIPLPDWGDEGQGRLKNASVLIAGAGGLGSPVALYLAAAGVGEIRLCDADTVELSNLNRQILHTEARIGQGKAASAAQAITALNSHIDVVAYGDYLDGSNVERIVGQADVVIDCLDNFETRYLLNAYCLGQEIPFIHGAVWGLMGQVTFIHPPDTPCLRCIFPQPAAKEVCPVVGVAPGVIGCIQAAEALKFIAGVGVNLKNKLLLFDGEDMSFTPVEIKRAPACPDCGSKCDAP
ncbi:MAG: HesA/MoeB/ThiF family protein [Thermoflexales bacterium]|nr:HesA/MoeB/ThiF family protein [Thermoflexales bacterium]